MKGVKGYVVFSDIRFRKSNSLNRGVPKLSNENEVSFLVCRFVFSSGIEHCRQHIIFLFFNSFLHAFHRNVCSRPGSQVPTRQGSRTPSRGPIHQQIKNQTTYYKKLNSVGIRADTSSKQKKRPTVVFLFNRLFCSF